MASRNPSPVGPSKKRAKRTSIACDHCRAKRLKCSGQTQGRSACTNCTLYEKYCQYSGSIWRDNLEWALITQSVSPVESSNIPPDTTTDKVSTDSFIGSTPTETGAPSTIYGLQRDELDQQLLRILLPIFTCLAEETPNPTPEFVGVATLSPRIMESFITAFFKNVSPLYPIVDEAELREILRGYAHDTSVNDPLTVMMLKIAAAVGGACNSDRDDFGVTRESLFLQVLSESHLLYMPSPNYTNVIQIQLLMALYCWQTERLNQCWNWLGWASRLPRQANFGSDSVTDTLLKRLSWCALILEGQLCLIQYRDDPRLVESRIPVPSEQFSHENPLLCFRLNFARIINRFSRLKATGCNEGSYTSKLELMNAEIRALKDTLPLDWRPGSEISAEPDEHQSVLIMHLEYHTFVMMLETEFVVKATYQPGIIITGMHNHAKVRVANARKVLQIFEAIKSTPEFSAGLTKWFSMLHVLSAFRVVYLQVVSRPSFISARSDATLLMTISTFMKVGAGSFMTGYVSKAYHAMDAMCNNALSQIHNFSGGAHTSPTPPPLSSALPASRKPSTMGQEITAGDSNLYAPIPSPEASFLQGFDHGMGGIGFSGESFLEGR